MESQACHGSSGSGAIASSARSRLAARRVRAHCAYVRSEALRTRQVARKTRINANAGRDHWTMCYTVLLAGAGIRGGTFYGASDAHAAYVKDNPVSTSDICATIYQCLGIDPDMLVYDRANRPVPIANGGRPIRAILA